MKVRIKFSKMGRLKYIGHLDLLNVWNRAVKSARLPVCYSKGFNPHMLISFAAPLSLGLESVSEYVDIDFDNSLDIETLPEKLNARFPDGLCVISASMLTEPYKRVASIVEAAEYGIKTPLDITDTQINGFMSQEAIEIMKKTKRKAEITDISPDILGVKHSEYGLIATLSCGSVKNLKPELFMEAFCRYLEAPAQKTKITRLEILCRNAEGVLTPLQ